MVETEVELQGVYDFAYAGGSFDVHLRSGGRFFAPEYQQPATWNYDPPIKKVSIDWLKYGKYELTLAEGGEAAKEFHGALVGKPESWRKMKLKRPFTVAEQMLMDSEWDFIHEGGSFRVNFKADGYNHFVCHDFPAHSHWRLDHGETPTPTLFIDWGKYGKYELVIDADGQSMSGGAKGNMSNWRKGKRVGKMGETGDLHVHDH